MSLSYANNSKRAKVQTHKIFASGTFKNVYKGTYTKGERVGQACVTKEFKSGSVHERHYFQEEMNIIRLAQKVLDDWAATKTINSKIVLSTPEIWNYEGSPNLCLVEPFIDNYEHFNSNTGWAPVSGNTWTDAMQALSHFSYHNSGGQYLMCDLQGGAFKSGYILSDPVIMSRKQNCGPADLGVDGIDAFFHRHTCTLFCKPEWIKPVCSGKPKTIMSRGTTMVTAHSNQSRTPLATMQRIFKMGSEHGTRAELA